MAWCVSPAISNASLLHLLWKIPLHFTKIIDHFITKFGNCDSHGDSYVRFLRIIVLSWVFESWQNSELMKEKVAVLLCGIGVSVDAAGHISNAVGGWWGTVTRITELCKHCGSIVMKDACSSFSLFVSNAITRLLLLDIGMTPNLWKNLNLPHPSLSSVASLSALSRNLITHTEAQMFILKAVNFLLSFV